MLQVAKDMSVVRNFLNCKSDVAEAFSQPRVTEEAKKRGFVSGFALDLTVKNELGEAWDFSKKSMRQKAWQLLKSQGPYMLTENTRENEKARGSPEAK